MTEQVCENCEYFDHEFDYEHGSWVWCKLGHDNCEDFESPACKDFKLDII